MSEVQQLPEKDEVMIRAYYLGRFLGLASLVGIHSNEYISRSAKEIADEYRSEIGSK